MVLAGVMTEAALMDQPGEPHHRDKGRADDDAFRMPHRTAKPVRDVTVEADDSTVVGL